MKDYSYSHLKEDADALIKHLRAAEMVTGKDREVILFRAGLRLMRLEKELEAFNDVILSLSEEME